MPVDTRRLPVPEDSKSPLYYVTETEKPEEQMVKDGKRKDGRTAQQVRPIFLRCGIVTKAKGSAYIELNNTKLICAVYGPREVSRREDFSLRGQLSVELQAATFCRRATRGQHQAGDAEKDTARNIEAALTPAVMLDKFPKARMDVFITVLEDDGGCFAAALTCASVALANAGLEMYDLVIGCSLRQYGALQLVDPTAAEEYKQHASGEEDGEVIVGYMPSLDQIAALSQRGSMDIATLNKAMSVCTSTCQRLYPVVQDSLVSSIRQTASSSGM